jgi:uncharacterized integral membrane protein
MKTKIILFMIIIVLFTFFVSQNTQIVAINVFFWQYNISEIILIVMTGFIGILLGLILDSIIRSSKKGEDKKIIHSPDNIKTTFKPL